MRKALTLAKIDTDSSFLNEPLKHCCLIKESISLKVALLIEKLYCQLLWYGYIMRKNEEHTIRRVFGMNVMFWLEADLRNDVWIV